MKNPLTLETASDRYVTTEMLGEGGCGHVYRGEDEGGTIYAIKVLDPTKVTTERRKRFKNELHFGMLNRHPNIITVSDHGVAQIKSQTVPFYVMPLYKGSLRPIIEQGIRPDTILPCFSQLLDGVEAAHKQNIIHRDLKPENILCTSQGGQISLVVSDFGAAHFEQEDLYTQVETRSTSRLANFQYAAPEQRRRGERVDHKADVYALGMILNEMFTGVLLQGTAYKTIEKAAPEYGYLDGLVEIMVRQNPTERPSIDEIKSALIARKNSFVIRQKINKLKNTVVPEHEVGDPIIADPIRLMGFDYGPSGMLVLELSQPADGTFARVFRDMGSYSSIPGYEPSQFSFDRGAAFIDVAGQGVQEIQRIINYFKGYLETANRDYKHLKIEQQRKVEEAERLRLQKDLEQTEQRKKVLESIKI